MTTHTTPGPPGQAGRVYPPTEERSGPLADRRTDRVWPGCPRDALQN